MTDEQIAVSIAFIRQTRPELDQYSDEELIRHCHSFSDLAAEYAEEEGCSFIRKKFLDPETEETLCTALINEVRGLAWCHIVHFQKYYSFDSFFKILHKSIEEFKKKTNAEWYDKMTQTIKRVDVNEALYYINEVMFETKRFERKFTLIEGAVPTELTAYKAFLNDCSEYLKTKKEVEPAIKKQKLLSKKNTFSLDKSKKLTIPQIALLYIYTNRHIDSSNADDIVKEESEETCISGALLIKKYNALSSNMDRVNAGPILKVKDSTRLKDIKTVIDILEIKGFSSEMAKADYHKLKTNIGNDIEK